MKLAHKMGLVFFLIMGTMLQPQKMTAQVSVSLQVFYDDLSPYGNWVDNPDYGYVWIPQVSQGFTPYNTNGHWVYTEVGWTWVSEYAWGWAPFHYGRWYNDSYYGWVWVPDTEWGPGWVSWRHSDDYYGWAPIGPGISIEIAYSSGYTLPNNQWTFVRNNDFGRTNINNYYINNSNNVTIINNTTIINNVQRDPRRNVSYNAGPDRTEVQRRTGTNFAPVAIKDRDQPGQKVDKNQLEIYRPEVQRSNAGGNRPTPSKVVDIKEVKPETQRSPKANTPERQSEPVKQSQGNQVPQTRANQPVRQSQKDSQKSTPTTSPQQQTRGNQPGKQPQQNRAPQQDKPTSSVPSQQQRNNQQAKAQQDQQERNNQQAKNQQVQQERNNQQAKDQQVQQQQNNQQAKSQQVQQQRNNKQAKEQQVQQQRNNQQAKKQQEQAPAGEPKKGNNPNK